jgi:peptide/nickel transport system substrate-binding protein
MRIALTAGLLLALGACPAMAAAPANPEATLVYYDAVSNQTLDPSEPQNNSSFSQGLLMAVYDSVLQLTPAGEPAPGLAESWSQNADLTEFTIKLRHGVTFHDGTKLDAAAVRANFERNMALGSRAGAAVA